MIIMMCLILYSSNVETIEKEERFRGNLISRIKENSDNSRVLKFANLSKIREIREI